MHYGRQSSALGWTLAALLAALDLVELHGPEGQKAYVNSHEISSLREPTAGDLKRTFPRNTRCIVVTTNAKFMAVVETCTQIRDMVGKDK